MQRWHLKSFEILHNSKASAIILFGIVRVALLWPGGFCTKCFTFSDFHKGGFVVWVVRHNSGLLMIESKGNSRHLSYCPIVCVILVTNMAPEAFSTTTESQWNLKVFQWANFIQPLHQSMYLHGTTPSCVVKWCNPNWNVPGDCNAQLADVRMCCFDNSNPLILAEFSRLESFSGHWSRLEISRVYPLKYTHHGLCATSQKADKCLELMQLPWMWALPGVECSSTRGVWKRPIIPDIHPDQNHGSELVLFSTKQDFEECQFLCLMEREKRMSFIFEFPSSFLGFGNWIEPKQRRPDMRPEGQNTSSQVLLILSEFLSAQQRLGWLTLSLWKTEFYQRQYSTGQIQDFGQNLFPKVQYRLRGYFMALRA